MKKTSLIVGLALGLGLSTSTFAGGWDYSKYSSREALIFSGAADGSTQDADASSQNSKAFAVKAGVAKEIGKMTVVQAEKGAVKYIATVGVTR